MFSVLFVISCSAPVIFYIYGVATFDFTGKDKAGTTQNSSVTSVLLNESETTSGVIYTEPQITEPPQTSDIPATTKITKATEIIETAETIETTEKPATTEKIPETSPPVKKTAEPKTEPPTAPPTKPPTQPPTAAPPPTAQPPIPATTAAPTEYINYDETPQYDFIQQMYANAFEIPGTSDIVEQPPKGRSIELQSKIVPLGSEIPEPFEYFKNIILLGDSVTTGFDLFRSRITYDGQAVMRDATVIASGSYGAYNSSRDISASSIHPLYQGKQMYPEDIIANYEAKIVFICLGLNDVGMLTVEKYIEYYAYLVDRIKTKNPDKIIVLMSVTPTVEGVKPSLNNEKIMASNDALIEYASANNLLYMDYGAALRDSNNSLYKSLASDGYCHLTIEGYNRLLAYILYHPVVIE